MKIEFPGSWHKRFYKHNSAQSLALARIFFFGSLIFYYVPNNNFWVFATLPDELLAPVGLSQILPLHALSWQTWRLIEWFMEVCLFFCLIGFAGKFFLPLTSILLFVLYSLANSYGWFNNLSPFVLCISIIFALSGKPKNLSIDSWLSNKKLSLEEENNCYTLLLLMQFFFVWLFFSAGYTKLTNSGWDWLSPKFMKNILITAHYWGENSWPAQRWNWNLKIAELPWMCTLLATLTLSLEILAPLVLISKLALRFIIPGLFLMQIGISTFVTPGFYPIWAIYIIWLPTTKG